MAKFVSMLAGMRARGMSLAAPVLAMPGVAVATASVEALGADLASLAPWGLPLGMFGMWFIWPAVKPEFKVSIGAMKQPTRLTPWWRDHQLHAVEALTHRINRRQGLNPRHIIADRKCSA